MIDKISTPVSKEDLQWHTKKGKLRAKCKKHLAKGFCIGMIKLSDLIK